MNARQPASTDRTQRRSRLWAIAQGLTRSLVLGGSVALLLAPWETSRWSIGVSALSPWVALCSVVVLRSFAWFVGLGLVVGLVTCVRRRWFCRWMCPAGICTDSASRVGRRLGRRRPRLPAIGRGIAWMTLAAACLGYPVLLWMDPLALFSSPFGLLRGNTGPGTGWSLLGLTVMLAISLVWPGIWCARLCPLGGLQDSCGRANTRLRQAIRGGRDQRPTPAAGAWPLSRRWVLGGVLGVLAATALRNRRGGPTAVLRPPGAIGESRFTGLCIRCGNCARVCPAQVIHPHLESSDIASLLTPIVHYRDDYCHETCARCTVVCPSGAIQSVNPDRKVGAVIGVPEIDMRLCLLGDDRECAVCRNRCPFEAIQLKFDETEYTLVPQVDLERCPGCGACEVACPTQPVKAIVIRPLSQEPEVA